MNLRYFNRLGKDIEQRWQAAGNLPGRFAEIARAALESHDLPHRLDHAGVVHEALRAPVLPSQSGAHFGQPPLNVHVGAGFYIEVLTWMEATTAIHQHNFCGAFQVLAGASLHTTHAFEEQHRLGNRLCLGNLRVRATECLDRGAARAIHAGAGLIHALFHLDHPSATIVVRTFDDGTGPQYQYAPPHIAYDPVWKPEPFVTQAALLAMLASIKDPGLDGALDALVEKSDAWCAWQLLQFANAHARGALDRLLEIARRRHGPLADAAIASLAESRRQSNIVLRRSTVVDPTQRFFLALLLNLPDRLSIFGAITDRYPGVTPADWIIEQIGQLSIGDRLGLTFDPVSLTVLHRLLQGSDGAAIEGEFERVHGRDAVRSQIGPLRRLATQMRESLMLRPLFA